MLEKLKQEVWQANLDLVKNALVLLTWGNVSAIDRQSQCVVIKPSGVAYSRMRPDDMVVTDLNGKVLEGTLKPSSDLPTHLVLYRAFPTLGGIVHTHSTFATAWAQAGLAIPNIGTTHADYFHGDIPCTDSMTEEAIQVDYEINTGHVIVQKWLELAGKEPLDPMHTPAVLVRNHGPFTWGLDPAQAVENALVLEETAKMAYLSMTLNPDTKMNPCLVEKHFSRKHGPKAYYGQ